MKAPFVRALILSIAVAVCGALPGCYSFGSYPPGYGGYAGYGYSGPYGGYYGRHYDPWYGNTYYDPFYPRGFGHHGFWGDSGFGAFPGAWGLPWFSGPIHPSKNVDNGSGNNSGGQPIAPPTESTGENPSDEPQLEAEGDGGGGDDFDGG